MRCSFKMLRAKDESFHLDLQASALLILNMILERCLDDLAEVLKGFYATDASPDLFFRTAMKLNVCF